MEVLPDIVGPEPLVVFCGLAGAESTKVREHYDVAGKAARALGRRKPGLGPAPWTVDRADVFVLPGTSGANQRHDYDGRPDRLSWWQDLAMLTGRR